MLIHKRTALWTNSEPTDPFTMFTRRPFSSDVKLRVGSSNAAIKRIMSYRCVPHCESYKCRESDKSLSFHRSLTDQQLQRQWIDLYDLQRGTQQYDIILLTAAFEFPTLRVTSEENGRRVNMVNGSVCLVLLLSEKKYVCSSEMI